ncbi:cell division protein FtsQ/DivIB [Chitinophagaceae bacterium MMS25-I14]
MAQKRKISIRKILQVFVTLIVTTGCVLAIMSASKIQDKKMVKGISINIRNEDVCHFLDKKEVENLLLNDRHIDLLHTPVTKLNLHSMEEIADANPWISDAQVYIDNQRVLHVSVTQRIPELRVFETDGNSYYLDTALKALPLSDRYVHYTPVITNVPELKDDSMSNDLKGQMMAVEKIIGRDSFWNAQVQEIVINQDREFELIPVLGNHRILLGDTSRLKDKLDNVFIFYRKVLNKIGWNRYEVLDARFKDQVAASPSLPWKAPKDQALANMNWVTSVLGDEKEAARKEELVGGQAATSAPAPAPAAPPAAHAPVAAPPVKHDAKPAPPVKKPVEDKKKTNTIQPKAANNKTVKHEPPVKKPAKENGKDKKKKEQEHGKKDDAPKPRYIYQGH